MKVSFVIPCYCSQHMLNLVVNEIVEAMQQLEKYEYEIILVNDCSPDATFKTICNITGQNEKVTGVDLAKNFGQHAALMAGFHQVTGDIVVCLDDDGQTPAGEVGKLLDKIEEGYDVVYASYENKRHSSFRNFGSWVNGKMTEFMLDKPASLMITSYFAARRFMIEEMIRYEHCYPYVIGLVLRSTKNICNVPVSHQKRKIHYYFYVHTISRSIPSNLEGFGMLKIDFVFTIKETFTGALCNLFFCFLGVFCLFVCFLRQVFSV